MGKIIIFIMLVMSVIAIYARDVAPHFELDKSSFLFLGNLPCDSDNLASLINEKASIADT